MLAPEHARPWSAAEAGRRVIWLQFGHSYGPSKRAFVGQEGIQALLGWVAPAARRLGRSVGAAGPAGATDHSLCAGRTAKRIRTFFHCSFPGLPIIP